MTATNDTGRRTEAAVDAEFPGRWSPRAFAPDPLTQAQIDSLFEAARWAPSSSNTQPWLFLYATDGPEREVFDALLVESNRLWAKRAPMLMFVLAAKFSKSGRRLGSGHFDTGAAWQSLALQARKMGLYTHPMGGFLVDESYAKLGVPRDRYDVIAAVAIGKRGAITDLPDELVGRETPSDRKPLAEVSQRGFFVAPANGD